MQMLDVRMLGELSVCAGENRISDSGSRVKRSWLLLAYLICQRGRVIPPKKLIDLLWGDGSENVNPENTLRITLHRTRALLEELWPGAGHELILHREGGYTWNTEHPIRVDCDEFERLCQHSGGSRLENLQQALALYRGEFLEKQSAESWVIPISAHFHNLYINAVLEAAALLRAQGSHKEAAAVCRRALPLEPYHEPLHQVLMEALAAAGDRKSAAGVYEALSKRLFDDFGIRPNGQTREVYRKSVHSPHDATLQIEEVLEHLQEPEPKAGAMECDYDYFKVLCHVESRNLERSGSAAHILLLSLADPPDKSLTQRSRNRIMEQLGEQIRLNLRRGDTFSRCSQSQYIILLPRANYENSTMVCRRIIGAFTRAHPYVTALIHYMAQPLTPSTCVP